MESFGGKSQKITNELTGEEKASICEHLKAYSQMIYSAKADRINLIAQEAINYLEKQKNDMLTNLPEKLMNLKIKDLEDTNIGELFKPEMKKVNAQARKSMVEVRESLKQKLEKGQKPKKVQIKKYCTISKMRYRDKDAEKFDKERQNQLSKSCSRSDKIFMMLNRRIFRPVSDMKSSSVTLKKLPTDQNGRPLWR